MALLHKLIQKGVSKCKWRNLLVPTPKLLDATKTSEYLHITVHRKFGTFRDSLHNERQRHLLKKVPAWPKAVWISMPMLHSHRLRFCDVAALKKWVGSHFNSRRSKVFLEHNLIKNVSNWVTFLWQTQIQTIRYGLNDTKRKKRSKLHWYFAHLHPLIWIFKRFWCPQCFWQKYCHKKYTQLGHSYLKYALLKHTWFRKKKLENMWTFENILILKSVFKCSVVSIHVLDS